MANTNVVDERVVEMKFDNRQFEANVRTSMNTIQRLKESLNFRGSTKSIENLADTINRVDASPLAKSFDAVGDRISAWEIAGISAINNVVNRAVDAGVKLTKSLSTDNIISGWNKYGEKTTSVATLVSQGYGLETVNEQLERLNWFTDETSYNFTDMVSNIAKFTATGQDLESSVTAMEGIATWAAKSGQNAQKASMAMYQLAQAMGKGALKLDDYKSIQNVSMDTDEFRQACLDAAVQLGTLKKNADDTYETLQGHTFNKTGFTEYLTGDMWLSSEVMMDVFNRYSSAVSDIYEFSEKNGVTASEAIKTMGGSLDSFGLSAFKAAQEARTWSDVIDSVKDAVSTGWMNTFTIIFGQYEEAKTLFTDLANVMYDIFAGGAEKRNDFLANALNSTWQDLIDFIKESNVNLDEFQDEIAKTFKEIEHLDLSDIIAEYGSLESAVNHGAVSIEVITKALMKFQKKTNDVITTTKDLTFGDVSEEVRAVQKALHDLGYDFSKWGLDGRLGKETQAAIKAFQEANNLKVTGVVDQSTLDALNEMHEASGVVINDAFDILNSLNQLSGRELLSETLVNLLNIVVNIKESISEAWDEIFPDSMSSKIYDILRSIHEFVESLVDNEEMMESVKHTFMGLFSVLKIVKNGFKISYKTGRLLSEKLFPMLGKTANTALEGIADFLIMIGDLSDEIVEPVLEKIEEFFNKLEMGDISDFPSVLQLLITIFYSLSTAVSYVIETISQLTFDDLLAELEALKSYGGKAIRAILDDFNNLWETFKESKFGSQVVSKWTEALEKLEEIFKDFKIPKFEDLKNSFKKLDDYLEKNNKTSTFVDRLVGTLQFFYESIRDWAKPAIELLISGLPVALNTLLEFFGNVLGIFAKTPDSVKEFFRGIKSAVKKFVSWWTELDIEEKLNIIKLVGQILLLFEVYRTLKSFGDLNESFAKVGESFTKVGDALTSFINVLKMNQFADLFKSLAISVAILAGCIFVLAQLDADKAWKSTEMILAIIGAMVTAQALLTLLQGKKYASGKASGIALSVLAIAQSMYILTKVFREMETLDPEKLLDNMKIVQEIIATLGGIAFLISLSKGKMASGAISVLALVAGLKMLIPVFKAYSEPEMQKSIETSYSVIFDLISVLGVSIALMGIASKMKGIGSGGITGAMVGIVAVLGAVYLFAKYLQNDIGNSLEKAANLVMKVVIATSILLFGVTTLLNKIVLYGKFLSKATSKLHVAYKEIMKGMLAVSVLLLSVASAIYILSKVEFKDDAFNMIMTAFVGIMGTVGIAVWMASKFTSDSTKGIFAMTAIVAAIAGVVYILSKTHMSKDNIGAIGAFIGIFTLIGVLLGVLQYNSKKFDIDDVMVAVLSLSALIVVLAGAIYALQDVKFSGGHAALIGGLIAFAVALVIIGKSSGTAKKAVAPILALSVGIVAIAGALLLAAKAMTEIKKSWDSSTDIIGNIASLLAIAGVLIGTLAILSTFSSPLLILSGAFAIFGVGVLLAGIGISSVCNAITSLIDRLDTLANTTPEIIDSALENMKLLVIGLFGIIPDIAAAGVAMVISFVYNVCLAIQQNAEPLMEAIAEVIVTVIYVILLALQHIGDIIKEVGTRIMGDNASPIGKALIDGLADAISDPFGFRRSFEAMHKQYKMILAGFLYDKENGWPLLKQSVKKFFNGFFEVFTALTPFGNLFNAGKSIYEYVVDGIDGSTSGSGRRDKNGRNIGETYVEGIQESVSEGVPAIQKTMEQAMMEAAEQAEKEYLTAAGVAYGGTADASIEAQRKAMEAAAASNHENGETAAKEYTVGFDDYMNEYGGNSFWNTVLSVFSGFSNSKLYDNMGVSMNAYPQVDSSAMQEEWMNNFMEAYNGSSVDLQEYANNNPIDIGVNFIPNEKFSDLFSGYFDGSNLFNMSDYTNGVLSANSININQQLETAMSNNIFDELANTFANGNEKIANSISLLRDDNKTLGDRISGLYVRLDTGALVGGLTPSINQTMGKMAYNANRG